MLPRSRNLARYGESFATPSLDAYETLLWNVAKNDASLFMGADQMEAIWRWLMPVLEAWAQLIPVIFPIMPPAVGDPEPCRDGSRGTSTACLDPRKWGNLATQKTKTPPS
jgi:hypothetical protein